MGRPRKDASTGGSSTANVGATAPTAKPASTRSAPSSARSKTTATAVSPAAPARPASSQSSRRTAARAYTAEPSLGYGDMNNNQDVGTKASSDGGKSRARASNASKSTSSDCGASKGRSTQPASVKAPSRDGYYSEPLHTFHEGLGKAVAEIEKETRGQRDNQKWHDWRENRITASMAHKIANSKFANDKTSEVPQSYLKSVTGQSSGFQTPATSWGINNEKRAVQEYEQLKSKSQSGRVKVEDCGLYIHPKKNWLAASPDGIVKDSSTGNPISLVEVKCPYKYKDHTVKDACKDAKFCLKSDGDSYTLKKDHPYYTQVQSQMATTGLKKTDFVVYTNKETAIAPVEFDPVFWKATEPKLEKFYTEAVIPHMESKAGQVWAKEE